MKGDDGWTTVGAGSPKKKKERPKAPTLEQICKGREKVLIVLRGLPGSGKSTLVESLEAAWVCSADDFFLNADGKYMYDVKKIGDAHNWCQQKALEMMQQSLSPVVIDNTHTRCWEAKVYVEFALRNGYAVEILQPTTDWAFDPVECARRNRHNVPESAIRNMLQRWEANFTVESIMAAQPPAKKPQRRPSRGGDDTEEVAQMFAKLSTNEK